MLSPRGCHLSCSYSCRQQKLPSASNPVPVLTPLRTPATVTIEQKYGHESRWGFEVCRWRLKSDGEKAEKARKGGREMTDEDMVASFENHMRLFQQRRDLSAKERANAVNVKPDYCTWCFKNKGAKFNNHTEATCRNKRRAEGGDPGSGGGDTKNGRGCHACDSKDHSVKDCPLVVKARALQTSTTENTATANVSAENKSSAGVPSNYSSSPQPASLSLGACERDFIGNNVHEPGSNGGSAGNAAEPDAGPRRHYSATQVRTVCVLLCFISTDCPWTVPAELMSVVGYINQRNTR